MVRSASKEGATEMNWRGLLSLFAIAAGTFVIIGFAAVLLITFYAPSQSLHNFIGFVASMFATTGAIVVIAIIGTRRIFP